jgi:hypothetical protein
MPDRHQVFVRYCTVWAASGAERQLGITFGEAKHKAEYPAHFLAGNKLLKLVVLFPTQTSGNGPKQELSGTRRQSDAMTSISDPKNESKVRILALFVAIPSQSWSSLPARSFADGTHTPPYNMLNPDGGVQPFLGTKMENLNTAIP